MFILYISARFRSTDFHNNSAGYLLPCVAGRFGRKIVGRSVDNDRAADDLTHGDPVSEEHRKRPSRRAEKRRHISRVVRMRTAVRVIMAIGIGKWVAIVSSTGAARMDMVSKDRFFAWLAQGQSHYLGAYHNTVAPLPEGRYAVYLRIFFASSDDRLRLRTATQTG